MVFTWVSMIVALMSYQRISSMIKQLTDFFTKDDDVLQRNEEKLCKYLTFHSLKKIINMDLYDYVITVQPMANACSFNS